MKAFLILLISLSLNIATVALAAGEKIDDPRDFGKDDTVKGAGANTDVDTLRDTKLTEPRERLDEDRTRDEKAAPVRGARGAKTGGNASGDHGSDATSTPEGYTGDDSGSFNRPKKVFSKGAHGTSEKGREVELPTAAEGNPDLLKGENSLKFNGTKDGGLDGMIKTTEDKAASSSDPKAKNVVSLMQDVLDSLKDQKLSEADKRALKQAVFLMKQVDYSNPKGADPQTNAKVKGFIKDVMANPDILKALSKYNRTPQKFIADMLVLARTNPDALKSFMDKVKNGGNVEALVEGQALTADTFRRVYTSMANKGSTGEQARDAADAKVEEMYKGRLTSFYNEKGLPVGDAHKDPATGEMVYDYKKPSDFKSEEEFNKARDKQVDEDVKGLKCNCSDGQLSCKTGGKGTH